MRQQHQGDRQGRLRNLECTPQNQMQAQLASLHMRAHDPSDGAQIGQCQSLIAQRMRTLDQFFRLRCPALK